MPGFSLSNQNRAGCRRRGEFAVEKQPALRFDVVARIPSYLRQGIVNGSLTRI
jgi:hypothetical protein